MQWVQEESGSSYAVGEFIESLAPYNNIWKIFFKS